MQKLSTFLFDPVQLFIQFSVLMFSPLIISFHRVFSVLQCLVLSSQAVYLVFQGSQSLFVFSINSVSLSSSRSEHISQLIILVSIPIYFTLHLSTSIIKGLLKPNELSDDIVRLHIILSGHLLKYWEQIFNFLDDETVGRLRVRVLKGAPWSFSPNGRRSGDGLIGEAGSGSKLRVLEMFVVHDNIEIINKFKISFRFPQTISSHLSISKTPVIFAKTFNSSS